MQYIWSVLCQKCTTNVEDGLVNLLSCISGIFYAPPKKLMDGDIIPGIMNLATLWMVEENEDEFLEYKVELISPDKKKIKTITESKIKVRKDKLNLTTYSLIKEFPYAGEGTYFFRILKKIEKKYKEIDEVPLKIKIKKT
jgi:hypothetical protein